MSIFAGKCKLSSTSDALVLDVPQDATYDAVVRLSGTFVGTIQIQSSTDLGATYAARTTTVVAGTSQGNPTTSGVYAIDCTSGADYLKVVFSAYTSGTCVAEALLIRQ